MKSSKLIKEKYDEERVKCDFDSYLSGKVVDWVDWKLDTNLTAKVKIWPGVNKLETPQLKCLLQKHAIQSTLINVFTLIFLALNSNHMFLTHTHTHIRHINFLMYCRVAMLSLSAYFQSLCITVIIWWCLIHTNVQVWQKYAEVTFWLIFRIYHTHTHIYTLTQAKTCKYRQKICDTDQWSVPASNRTSTLNKNYINTDEKYFNQIIPHVPT